MTERQDDAIERRTRWLSNCLQAAWRGGLAVRPDLDLLSAKAAEVPRGVFGGNWHEALTTLVNSLKREAQLNPIGETFAWAQLSRLIAQRRRGERLWSMHPEIARTPIASPIIVVGPMRSGTTRLQRLLGCDPRLNHTRLFEVTHPVPGRIDWRLAESWLELALLDYLNPQLRLVHPTTPKAVEEVFGLLSFSFYGAQFEAQWRAPGFARYWEGQDRGWVYRELRLLLQTIAWQRGASAAPWVLKAPQFMEDLGPLLAAFPDARLLCLSREPSEVVTSSASLVWNQMRIQSDSTDRAWIGREWLRKTVRREALCREVRAARNDVPQLEVDFAAVNADWRGQMRRIYAFLGMELPAPIEKRMARYLQEAEVSGFRSHRYRPADFGLKPDAIRAAHASYQQPSTAAM